MEYAILGVVALLIGLGVGWYLGGRPAAELKTRLAESEREAKETDAKYLRAYAELEAAREKGARVDALEAELKETRARHETVLEEARRANGALSSELATLKEKTANFDEQKRLLVEAREELLKEFQNTGSAVLSKAQEAFLERASERFGHSEKSSEEKIRALLAPVGDRLKKYEDQVAALEEKRTNAFSSLAAQIEQMRLGQEEVRREAQRLGNSLTNAPKARGRWGERALQNVLEQCGLSEHTDFNLEQSLETAEGRLRPDAIVNVPGSKKLVIDAKVSLNAYQAAFEAEDEGERKRHLDLHAKSMRGHVQTLGSKSYQSQFDDAPDYVVMFVPGEHFVAAALDADPELWDFAFRNKVLLATPTNLVAIARTVAQVWRQDTIAKEAMEIGKAGGELYDRLAIAAEHMKRVGGGLESAVKNYNKFVGSFERNVLSAGRRLSEKGIEIGKREIEEIPQIAETPTYTSEDVAALEDEGEGKQLEDARDAAE
ncbi:MULTISPECIES: DNA recombination protein RmuC [Citromicrobium]|uniref:DNA recombination protein RmuC n=1 Tax=Citromicrobium TaxID=72173 RepID=UPI0001DD1114|nr:MULTISPECIES: DNA recombination protein RmuC [Citromicrobium]ALG60755.1 DNA recombinase [Citromicrobium sp. JL477]KPM14695.1 DNA recombinase [Citromicrobium sp. JL1351]KPM19995.1 DNA recombinase [Citromicrobium sp. JL31]KPM22951.1 DNA recombinase [Citromicrobium sp. JL2201]